MGAAVAAIIIRREKDLVSHFRERGATSSATAQSLSDLLVDDALILRRLRERAVIREASSGLFYLDELSWAAIGRTRQRLVTVLLLVAIAVAAAMYLTLAPTAGR